jgi:uncharacterized coiled-coil DUF342 family protein
VELSAVTDPKAAAERIAALEGANSALIAQRDEALIAESRAIAELAKEVRKREIAEECYASLRGELAACKPYCKDGETVTERLTRYHQEVADLMGQIAKVKAERDAAVAWKDKMISAYERGVIHSSDGSGYIDLLCDARKEGV